MMDDISALVGQTIAGIKFESDGTDTTEVLFSMQDGKTYRLWHDQDCCEDVHVEDVIGDWLDLVGSPVLHAESVSSPPEPEIEQSPVYDDSHTWTFYKIATIKGSVTIRWLGQSNGYYSEDVRFDLVA